MKLSFKLLHIQYVLCRVYSCLPLYLLVHCTVYDTLIQTTAYAVLSVLVSTVALYRIYTCLSNIIKNYTYPAIYLLVLIM